MTTSPRDYVLQTLSHRRPDKVVVDLGATSSTGISAIAYNNLKKKLGLSGGRTRVFDVIQQLVIVEDEVLDQFDVALVSADRYYNPSDGWNDAALADGSAAQWPGYCDVETTEDGSRHLKTPQGFVVGRMPAGGAFFDQTHFPYADGYPDDFSGLREAMKRALWGACPRSPWQEAAKPDFWHNMRNSAQALRDHGRAVVLTVGCNIVEWGMFLRRMDNFLMDIYAEPDNVKRLAEALAEIHMTTLQNAVEQMGDLVDVFRFGDDMGMDNAPFMSPQIYRDIFKPHHRCFCEYVKKHTKAFTCLHCCGSIYELIPDLIDAGYDCLNPIQTNCRNMDPVVLKREFGNDLTFWGGGCDTRTVLNQAGPDDVRKHVLERLEIFAPGGGFVFCTVHNILPEVPPENIIAMMQAVQTFNGS